jgi:pimeloyl-ACP methyl ester carboxylesterase
MVRFMDARFTPAHRGGDGPPLLLLHGFTDTWRTWELVLPTLEREREVLAPTLAGHAGGPPLPEGGATADALLDAIEAAMDDAGWDTADVAGNSLGGHLALRLAARGRARSVVALAPAGGWAEGDTAPEQTLQQFVFLHEQLQQLVPHADAIAASPEGRARATMLITERSEHLPAELIAHQLRGAAACDVPTLVAHAREEGWPLDVEAVTCPVRFVWGTEDKILGWPGAATRYQQDWFPQAEWVVLDGVGHCPQLDVPTETAQHLL